MTGRLYKFLLVGLALVLLASASWTQQKLNAARTQMGLTRLAPLENAPPVLAFTTVALGSFRGLIANALWIRATELSDEGKYFEMVQLADWITKLQPHFSAVWVNQAWNLVYNISIKFNDPKERWQWVLQGIELLRDQGLRYNPKEPLIYRELAWFFQHKMGAFLDDAHMYYKQVWAQEMTRVLGGGRPNYEELLNPQTDEAKARVKLLREKYKLDPARMKAVDEKYGPLEWRLPEAHAIYWAMIGLELSKKEDLITLRRVIYQSLQLAFQRGRLIQNPFNQTAEFGPNLDMIENANRAYLDMMEQDPESREHIKTGHRNFLRDAVYFLYTHNRLSDANRWFRQLQEKYPNMPLITARPKTLPGTLTLDEYAIARVTEDASETSTDRTKAILEGLWVSTFYNLALGEDDQAAGYTLLAQKIWNRFQQQIAGQEIRVGLPPLETLRQEVLNQMLNPTNEMNPQFVAQLRTRLNLPAPTNAPPPATNQPAGRN
jgi:hypothetical protein